jgi:hypothetical protein
MFHELLPVVSLAAAWLFSLWLMLRFASRLKPLVVVSRFAAVLRKEDGGAYTFSFVMVVPIYFLLICFIIETGMMLVAKVGTIYSAFAGARTSIVWNTSTTERDAQDRTVHAARQAMVPFASGLAQLELERGTSSSSSPNAKEQLYIESYRAQRAGRAMLVSEKYLRAKHRFAYRATDVEVVIRPLANDAPWREDVIVTVTYTYPFLFPGISRIFGTENRNGLRGLPISSQVILQNEAPQNEEKQLGITYASP